MGTSYNFRGASPGCEAGPRREIVRCPHFSQRELVILVGMQGSGKTRYCRRELKGYVRLSQDEGPRTFDGIVRRLEALLQEGAERIVIDRTNPRRSQRDIFVSAAKRFDYRIRIVYFDVPEDVCRKRIIGRRSHPTLDAGQIDPAIRRYCEDLDPPVPEECDELVVVKK